MGTHEYGIVFILTYNKFKFKKYFMLVQMEKAILIEDKGNY